MDKILEGLKRFQTDVFEGNRTLFKKLATGQDPHAMVITCADSRVAPFIITQSDPGDLFVLRNAGNIVPQHSAGPGAEAAAIELAVVELEVNDIIVLGHSDCGAMKLMLHPEHMDEMPSMSFWLEHAGGVQKFVESHRSDYSEQELLDKVIEANVMEQLGNLLTHPSVSRAVVMGKIRLHGWVYDIESGKIKAYDLKKREFVPMA